MSTVMTTTGVGFAADAVAVGDIISAGRWQKFTVVSVDSCTTLTVRRVPLWVVLWWKIRIDVYLAVGSLAAGFGLAALVAVAAVAVRGAP